MSRRQRAARPATVATFPEDFPQRLERLREASGLTWREFAWALGVNLRSVHRWRAGAAPDSVYLIALFRFAAQRDLLDCLVLDCANVPDDLRELVLGTSEEPVQPGMDRPQAGDKTDGASHQGAKAPSVSTEQSGVAGRLLPGERQTGPSGPV